MPAHTHSLHASAGDPDDPSPNNALLGTFPNSGTKIYSQDDADVLMNGGAIGSTGGNQPVLLYQPSVVVNYCIVSAGIYPTRN